MRRGAENLRQHLAIVADHLPEHAAVGMADLGRRDAFGEDLADVALEQALMGSFWVAAGERHHAPGAGRGTGEANPVPRQELGRQQRLIQAGQGEPVREGFRPAVEFSLGRGQRFVLRPPHHLPERGYRIHRLPAVGAFQKVLSFIQQS